MYKTSDGQGYCINNTVLLPSIPLMNFLFCKVISNSLHSLNCIRIPQGQQARGNDHFPYFAHEKIETQL